mmetsp:Transcript_116520/g.163836  ORF Transcript_116520/g.163836 Transcript_116520/m.163836 type:complete len:320 (+) Transcript_116520:18-977(+)
MSNPGQFRDFNKSANDLLTKVFPKKAGANSFGFEYDLKPTNYYQAGFKVNSSAGKSTGEASSEVVFEDFGVTFKSVFKTADPSLEASWKVSDKIPVDGLSAKLCFDASDKSQYAGLSVAFAHEYFTLNGKVQVGVPSALVDFVSEEAIKAQDTKLDLDFVASHPDYNVFVGGLVKAAFPQEGEQKIKEGQASLGWRDAELNTVANYTQSTKKNDKGVETESRKVNCSVRVKPAETTYVGNVEYNLDNQGVVATLALEYPLNDGAVVKAKVSTEQQVGFAYTNKISDSATVSFGTLMAIKSSDKGTDVDSGFSFTLKFRQ